MHNRCGWVVGATASAFLPLGGPAAAIECEGDAATGFICEPAGPVAVGAVFATSGSDARRNISIAVVTELIEEEGEEIGQGAGDGLPLEVFATLLYGDRDQDAQNLPGLESDTWGGVLGVGWRGHEYFAGAAIDYSSEDADFDEDAGSQDTDELGIQVFGTWMPRAVSGLYVSAVARYSGMDIETSRTFLTDPSALTTENQGLLNTARGSTDGRAFGLTGGAGYSLELQPGTMLSIEGWLAWQDIAVDGYTEQGAIAQGGGGQTGNLRFDDDDYSTLDGILTATLQQVIPMPSGRLIPGVSVSYVHEFDSDTRTVDAVLAGAPDQEVVFRTNRADRDYFRLGAFLSAELRAGTSVMLTYSGTVGHDWRQENLVTLGVSQAF